MNESVPAYLRPLSVAPMVAHTDRHCRMLLRLVAPHATLYTEMTVAQAVVFGDISRILGYSQAEQPVIAQLAGRDPDMLARAAQIVEEQQFAAVNLNVGCPSKRVKSGGFGACLMEESSRLFQIVTSMRKSIKIPLTVKCRIGTERVGGFDWLVNFVKALTDSGVDGVVIHARIAKLDGVSTRYNLTVPPLDWDLVGRVQAAIPDLPITINGGIDSVESAERVYSIFSRIMIGRLAIKHPHDLAAIHGAIYPNSHAYSPLDIVRKYGVYIREQLSQGVPLHAMTRHMIGLFRGLPGAKKFRQTLSERRVLNSEGMDLIEQALESLELSHALVHATDPR